MNLPEFLSLLNVLDLPIHAYIHTICFGWGKYLGQTNKLTLCIYFYVHKLSTVE